MEPKNTEQDRKPISPYIGIRAFSRRDRNLFFGRPEEGLRLRDKILGSRLVTLYAPSGAGKSSLLRAMVIPQLEALDSVVLYVSRWKGRNPDRIRRQLRLRAWLANAKHSASVDAGLAGLADVLSRELDLNVIIILDQFEQCLMCYSAAELESLRSELSRLVRSNERVRLVLSLREEYLARLEILRPELPNLFQSTFFLPRMKRKDGVQAIVGPAMLFGKTWDPKLVEQLLDDLRPEANLESGSPATAEGLELPFLQIVCRELWTAAERLKLALIPKSLYDDLGKKKGIISQYVNELMGVLDDAEQVCASEMLRYLAPPSGVKMSHPAQDLVDYTRKPKNVVIQVASHLIKEKVLRESAVVGGQSSYELCHDAYIGMLRPWAIRTRQKAMERRAFFGAS